MLSCKLDTESLLTRYSKTATATDYATTTLPLIAQRAPTVNPIACTSGFSPVQLSSDCSCLSITPSTTYTTATSTNTLVSTAINTIIATATPTTRCTRNTNLITNPSFESGFNSWAIAPYGANTPPTFTGVIGGGLNSTSAYSISSGPSGTGAILSVQLGRGEFNSVCSELGGLVGAEYDEWLYA
ncbi:hypothetical protein IFR05_003219 [Cadophora sp. M221]|nr:hypothetical protein IFR05_003219 [Cadophora sp. M221]